MKILKARLHLPVPVSCFFAVILVAAAIALQPSRSLGQDANSAVKPDAVSMQAASPSDSKPESGLSEQEKQNEAFLHEGPVVKWTAKTLNLSIDSTAVIFEVINFLIIVLAIFVPLFKFLPRYLKQRKQKLSDDIESARKVTLDANARLNAVEAKLAKIDGEIQKFRTEVEAESKNDEARIKASLTEESARIVEAAEQEIGQAAAQARRGLRNFAADLAIDQAARQLNLTPEVDRALIAEFVTSAGNGNSSKGGIN